VTIIKVVQSSQNDNEKERRRKKVSLSHIPRIELGVVKTGKVNSKANHEVGTMKPRRFYCFKLVESERDRFELLFLLVDITPDYGVLCES
jgi:hypothetical protein